MTEISTNGRTIAAVQEVLLRRADELSSAWAAQILSGCPGADESNRFAALPEQASRLVHEVVAGIDDARAAATADPSHTHAFAAAAIQAGVALPDVLKHLDGLATLLLEAAAEEIMTARDLTPPRAFQIADRIHRGVRAIATATGDAYLKADPGGQEEDGSDRFESFTRTIAHELKNPLGAARGAAELLITGEGTETQESRVKFAELVLRNVNRALELLDEVRMMTRTGGPGLNRTESGNAGFTRR